MDGARLSLGVDSPSDADSPRDRSSDGEHAAFDAPISAAAAAAAVGASEGARARRRRTSPLAVINAAVRHVRRGTFSLPFRVTTRGIGALKGRGKSKHRSSQEAGSAAGGGGGGSSLDPRQKRSAKNASGKGGTFHNAGALHGDATTVEQEADAAATMMFHHLRRAGQPFVTPDAVADFVEADKVEEAFLLIGGADSGVRALAEANISAAMRVVYLEREALGKTLSDTSNLVNNVGVLIAVVLGTVTLFISLGVFRVDVASLWLVTSSALLAFAFVFGTTAATMFRTLIMIFVTNPFGVGDWIRINEQIVRVTELGLNFFVVVNFWGEVIFLPASQVLDARIFNLSRSPPLWMNTAFDVDIGVSAADIDHIQTVMSAHVDFGRHQLRPGILLHRMPRHARPVQGARHVLLPARVQRQRTRPQIQGQLEVPPRAPDCAHGHQLYLHGNGRLHFQVRGATRRTDERAHLQARVPRPRRRATRLRRTRRGVAESRRVSFSHGARAPDGAGSDVARGDSPRRRRFVFGASRRSDSRRVRRRLRSTRACARRTAHLAPARTTRFDRRSSPAGFASDGAAKIIIAETIPASMGVDGTAASAGAHLPRSARMMSSVRVSTFRGSGRPSREGSRYVVPGEVSHPRPDLAFTRGCFATCAKSSRSTRTRDSSTIESRETKTRGVRGMRGVRVRAYRARFACVVP